jgi:putative ABC transport system substrate-binding protein
MKRRTLITAMIGSAFAGAGRAQQAAALVGVLVDGAPDTFILRLVDALRRFGYEPDKNIRYEVRSNQGDAAGLSGLANELVEAGVDVLVARLTPAVLAASRATQTIPIVMAGAGDPVGNGLVESLARPGRNVTGVAGIAGQLSGKLVELVRDTIPNTREIVVLANPTDIFTPIFIEEIKRVGHALGISTTFTMIVRPDDLQATFETFRTGGKRPQAVIVQPSLQRAAAATLALVHRLPSFSPFGSFADEGGLMGYSSNQAELLEQTAAYVDKIIRGAKPDSLPVSQPTRFDLVINMRTARAIGVVVPPTVLMRASSLLD